MIIPFMLGVVLASIGWAATLLIERVRIENRIWREEYEKFRCDPRGYINELEKQFTECQIREEEAKELEVPSSIYNQ